MKRLHICCSTCGGVAWFVRFEEREDMSSMKIVLTCPDCSMFAEVTSLAAMPEGHVVMEENEPS